MNEEKTREYSLATRGIRTRDLSFRGPTALFDLIRNSLVTQFSVVRRVPSESKKVLTLCSHAYGLRVGGEEWKEEIISEVLSKLHEKKDRESASKRKKLQS